MVLGGAVDLKSRLSSNIESSYLYYLVRGLQLYVCLITSQLYAKSEPPNGPAG